MLTDAVLLDISQAQRQIDQLEAELRRLSQPVRVPIDIEGEQAIAELRRDVQGADSGFDNLNDELAETDRGLDRVRTSADRAGRELETTGRRGVSSFNGLSIAAGAFGVALAAAVGVRAFIGFAGQAIDAASNFEESLSKTNVVFGTFSKNIQNFASNAPQALGLSTAAALEATSTFGNLFVALGLTQQEAANLSPEIVQLAADLASFNNIEVGEAVEKLRSGLVGEAEPLRVLGVNLTEATVAAKALELGLAGSTGTLTEAAKVQARYALILEQTATAQGDFARTADGIANTQRTVAAEFENVKQKIGEALLPAYQAILDISPAVIAAIEDLTPVINRLATGAGNAAPQLQTLAEVIQSASVVPGLFGAAFELAAGGADVLVGALQQVATGAITGEDGLNRMDRGLENIGNTIDNLDVTKLQDSLVRSLIAGVDPALALADALVVLGGLDLDFEGFENAAASFLQIANLNPSRLIDLTRKIQAEGTAAGLTAEEVKNLHEQIAILLAPSVFSPEAARGNLLESLGVDPTTVPALTDTAAAILEVAQAGESLKDFAPDVGFEGFTGPLDALTSSLDSAREALKDDEGAIVDDLNVFFDQLNADLAARAAFAANLTTLRLRGEDILAGIFEDLGPDAAQLAADAVTDPANAAREEARLEAYYNQTFANALGASLPEITGIIEAFEPPPVVIPLTFGGLPDFPISALTAGGVGIGGQVTVTIVNPTTNDLISDSERAGQIIGAGVTASRTGPQ